jgi:predicted signal transduction protein with EAL and GGDEF domain
VTISAGVASAPDNANDAERLMAAADAALYDAKRNGRDRVEASTRSRDGAAPASLSWSTPLARGA